MAPEMELEMEPARALGTAPLNQWVLSFQPLLSFAVADPLTWWDNVSPEASAARALPEEKLLSATEAQRWVLERTPLAGLSCGLKERKTWPLWFAPFRVAEIWPKLITGEDERRFVRRQARARRWTVCKNGALSFWNPFAAQMIGIYKNNGILRVILSFVEKGQFRSKKSFS